MGTECFQISWSGKAQKNSEKGIDIFVIKNSAISSWTYVHEKNDVKLDQTPVGFTSPNKTTCSDKASESVPITIVEDKH